MSAPKRARKPTMFAEFETSLSTTPSEEAAVLACQDRARLIYEQFNGDDAGLVRRQYLFRFRSIAKNILGDDHPAIAELSTKVADRKWAVECDKEDAPLETEDSSQNILSGPPPDNTTAVQKIARADLNLTGRPVSLQKSMAAFTALIQDIHDEGELEEAWALELAKYNGKANATRLTYVARYRKDIRDTYGDDAWHLSVCVAPPDLVQTVASARNAKILDEHRNLVAIPQWRDIISKAVKMLSSSDPIKIGAGLLALTGRRPVEIFTSGVFEYCPLAKGTVGAMEKWSVMFFGQAKTRMRPGTQYGKAYPIPVLAPARTIITALERLRAHPDAQSRVRVLNGGNFEYTDVRWADMTGLQFSETLSLTLRDYVVKELEGLWPNTAILKPYALRSLYVTVAYKQFCSPTISFPSYICSVLGHTNEGGKGLETAHAYMDYYLPDDSGVNEASIIHDAVRRRNANRERIRQRLEALEDTRNHEE